MATQADPSYFNIEDPEDVRAQDDQAAYAQMGATRDPYAANRQLIIQGVKQVAGDPKVQAAANVQNQFKSIMQNVQEASPGDDEDPLALQLRTARAVAAGMSGTRPDMAMQANLQAVAAQQAMDQRKLLSVRTETEQVDLAKKRQDMGIDQARSIVQVTSTVKGADGLPEIHSLGDPIDLSKDGGNQALQDALVTARKSGGDNVSFSPLDKLGDSKANLALIRGQYAIQQQKDRDAARVAAKQGEFGGLSEDALKDRVVALAINPRNALSTLPADQKIATYNYAAAHGVHTSDMAAAQVEYQALQKEAASAAGRVGQVELIQNTMKGLGSNVLDALGNVDRGRMKFLNSVVAAGKTQFSDPNEKAYAGAVQSFVQEYARLVSGATGVTSDTARNEAHALLDRADGPEAVRAAIKQLGEKETQAIANGGAETIAALSSPKRFPHLLAMQEKLGVKMTDSDNASANGPAPPDGQATPTVVKSPLANTPNGSGGSGKFKWNPQTHQMDPA